MIDFNGVSFAYGKEAGIKDISFHIDRGEFVAVLGSNGAGKTTLSKMINGLIKPQKGTVTVGKMNTAKTKTSALAGTVGFLFQNPDRQICKNTVAQEIEFSLTCSRKDLDNPAQRARETALEYGFDPDSDPFTLSRGERQLLALVSVIAVEPEVLVLDEPTTGMDYDECISVMDRIKLQNQRGVTVVMVTHDMEIVADYADRVLILSDGVLEGDGDKREYMCNRENRGVLEKSGLLLPQIAGLAMCFEDFGPILDVDEIYAEILKRKEVSLNEGLS